MALLPDVAVGTVIASLVAGVVSLIGLIISKEQKISDFRQAWIDDLRTDIALLITHANAVYGSSQVPWENLSDRWKDCRADFIGLNDATGRIRLRLNPSEDESKTILDTIEQIEKLFKSSDKLNPDQINDIEKRLVAETNTVLKMEWRRVKNGELVYRIARLSALLFVISAVILLLVVSFRDISTNKAMPGRLTGSSNEQIKDPLPKQE